MEDEHGADGGGGDSDGGGAKDAKGKRVRRSAGGTATKKAKRLLSHWEKSGAGLLESVEWAARVRALKDLGEAAVRQVGLAPNPVAKVLLRLTDEKFAIFYEKVRHRDERAGEGEVEVQRESKRGVQEIEEFLRGLG